MEDNSILHKENEKLPLVSFWESKHWSCITYSKYCISVISALYFKCKTVLLGFLLLWFFGFLFFSFLLDFSSEINLETQNADDVAVLEDCTGFSLAKTVSEIEGKVEKGGLPDCLDDDIIPNTASEVGAGRFHLLFVLPDC